MIKVFYSQNQNVKTNSSFSPSAGKPEQVVQSWKDSGLTFEMLEFAPVTRDDLKLAHDENYVDGVLDLKISNGFGNKNQEVATALPWVAGSMVAAALEAYKNEGITISPTSGAHHACYASGGGFCTFNFLILAAIKAQLMGANKVGIIDLDCHFGDGSVDIIKKLDLNFIKHYSYGSDPLARKDSDAWLKKLPEIITSFKDCDLVIYNAGVDSHIDDPLGGYLTTKQIEERDKLVISILRAHEVPITISLAGGYQKDEYGQIPKVLELHLIMFKTACKIDELNMRSRFKPMRKKEILEMIKKRFSSNK